MKKFLNVVALLAVVAMISACGISMDTIKYANGTSNQIQTAPCEVATVDEVPVVIAKATKIKILEPVMFDWDKSVIRADQEDVLNKVAALMAEYPDTALVLDGYASEECATDYNLALSQDRADAVKSALIMKGVDADRIVNVVGQGEATVFGDLLKLNRRVMVLSVD
jgi:outer membrane protein OmpA-like peptidoglycan-associated protein